MVAVPTYIARTKNLDGSSSYDAPHNNLEFAYTLNGAGSATWTMPIRATGVTRANFEPWKREVDILRNGTVIWGGIVDRVAASTGGEEIVRVGAVGHFARLFKRVIDVKRAYDNIDQFDIAWDLIEWTQAKANGNIGITRGAAPDSGVLRDATYQWWERRVIGEVIELNANHGNGFDFDLSPTKVFNMYYPRRGSAIADVFTLGGNVQNINIDLDGSGIASDIHAIGSGDKDRTCIAVVTDATAQSGYKRLEAVVDFLDIKHFANLQDKANRELALHKGPRVQPQLSVQTDDPPWGNYAVGDNASIVANYGFLNYNANHRIIAIVVHLNTAGNESITVHFDEVLAP